MGRFYCFYYSLSSGRMPVKEFVESLESKTQGKFSCLRRLLEELGKELKQPHSKHLGSNIFELRFQSEVGTIRVLYFFWEDKVVMTNAFVKKSVKVPLKEIELAKQRREIFIGNQQEER
ncbi:MAG: hypothetical protein A2879_05090 [Omnitrophica WOR_2 bacterium RIFCSPHIGHO2_01_FULL_49_10]|nr:MAG: hypothetical protein A2879_05090 [Omnitrophica WOR_2 bacterium RIFCSPHIGHO2_01_FULL_49_10]OGX32657.1 MAG: hypothetical protein A3I43_03235 [Omnitrophica WOR_2 bacterium RIFCSPLOWO2_02_FULL_50_19]